MRQPVKNYLSITKKEWNGLIVLMLLIVLVMAAPAVYHFFKKDKPVDFSEIEKATAALRSRANHGFNSGDSSDHKNTQTSMFAFDPNNLPDAKWKQLGLDEHQIQVLKHYEAKGGKFRAKEDLKRIYAITSEDYARLEPYIQIATMSFPVVELNTADSARLTEVRGIGPVFAMRIIRYRNKLGGFHSKEQVKEVFGVDEEKYVQIEEQIRVDPRKVSKLNVNAASFDDLRRFPYLSYKQMNAIVQYRKEHGDYDSLDDMRNVAILDDEILRKIEPYIVFK